MSCVVMSQKGLVVSGVVSRRLTVLAPEVYYKCGHDPVLAVEQICGRQWVFAVSHQCADR